MRRGSTGRYQMTSVAGEVVRAFPAAAKAIDTLQKLGIVQEITGRQRNRAFAYQNYLKILSEGTEVP